MTAPTERDLEAPDVIRALNADGSASPEHDPGLGPDEARALYRAMLLTRQVDQRIAAMAQGGRAGFHAGSLGEEAAVIGAASALGPRDWVFPGHRELGAALHRGVPLSRYFDSLFGNASDVNKGRQMPDHGGFPAARIASVSSLPAAHLTQAVGLSWAARSRGDDALALAYFGEAAASSGDFHNAMNFAGVFKTPTLFLCRNSGWAAPAEQSACESVAHKGVAYGVEALRCDGADLLGVISACRRAVQGIRSGSGPALVECLTTRLGADPDRDPVARLRRYLERQGLWGAAQQAAAEAEHEQQITAALQQAERSPDPPPESLFDDVYATPPWHLIEQRDQLLRTRGGASRSGS